MSLKKKLQNRKTCSIRDLNKTNFVSAEITETISVSNDKNSNLLKKTFIVPSNYDNNIAVDSVTFSHRPSEEYYEFIPEEKNPMSVHNYSQSLGSSRRQLNQFNSESYGDVAVESAIFDLGNNYNYLKCKSFPKDIIWNKENIKVNTKIPDIKFLHTGGKTIPSFYPDVNQLKSDLNVNHTKISKNMKKPNPDFSIQPDGLLKNFSKPYKNLKVKGSPHSSFPDTPQDMESSPSNSDKGCKTNPKASTSQNSPVSGVSQQTVSEASSSSGVSNQRHSNKPYLRQLFEQDIQSNFEKSSKKEPDPRDSQKASKPPEESTSASDQKPQQDSSSTDPKSTTVIPSNVLGFDFLTTLKNRVDVEHSEESQFPASVIGQSFLKALIEQKEKIQENTSESKSIPSSVVGLSFLKSLMEETPSTKQEDNQPLPASVIGQTFLKNLLSNQLRPDDGNSKSKGNQTETTPQSLTLEQESEKEQVIPSSVIGQAFLKTLVDTQDHIPKTEDSKSIPSTVLGQSFLKSLIEHSDIVHSENIPTVSASSGAVDDCKQKVQEKVAIPQTIPATVVGQSFLKNLLEIPSLSSNSDISGTPVKDTLSSSQSVSSNDNTNSKECSAIPATVIGQSFLNILLKETASQDKPSEKETIPSTVIGQSFIKTLLESESLNNTSSDNIASKQIPAPVICQTFLKSLINESKVEESEKQTTVSEQGGSAREGDETPKNIPETSKTVPATVIGQSFLKSLIETQSTSENKNASPIPAAVIGQAFLKTLSENQPSDATKQPSIPAPVIGQTFLKSLLDQSEEAQEAKTQSIPASVVGQAFLKTLIEKETITSSSGDNSIEQSNIEKSDTKPIPSSVLSQAFLKTLLEETQPIEKENVDSPIPANVIGQTFLKSLIKNESESDSITASNVNTKGDVEKIIPSTVVGQTFLKSLSQDVSSGSDIRISSDNQKTEASIPASVIGLAFLKTLSDQSSSNNVKEDSQSKTQVQVSKKPVQANVVGQAFLKTLVDLASDSAINLHKADETSCAPETSEACKDCVDSSNAANYPDPVEECEGETTIIPPPPEFCSSDDSNSISGEASGSSTNVDVTPAIIGELLSYTKMMHSVIESMKDPEKRE